MKRSVFVLRSSLKNSTAVKKKGGFMSLVAIGLAGDGSVEVRPNIGGEAIVSAFFRSLIGKSEAVECFGISDVSHEFVIGGSGIDCIIPLSEKDSKLIDEFLQNPYSVQALKSSPEDGFKFIAR